MQNRKINVRYKKKFIFFSIPTCIWTNDLWDFLHKKFAISTIYDTTTTTKIQSLFVFIKKLELKNIKISLKILVIFHFNYQHG